MYAMYRCVADASLFPYAYMECESRPIGFRVNKGLFHELISSDATRSYCNLK